jgi:hypothetical protein
VKLEPPYSQYEGRWLTSPPPIKGHKYARIYFIRFIRELHDNKKKWPSFECAYMPEDYPTDYHRHLGLSGDTYEEYEPTESDMRNVVTAVFDRRYNDR